MRKRSTTAAFSLVEVTLAIGVAAFCLIAVIGMFPVGVQTNRNATSQTVATNIMAAVVTDLRSTLKSKSTSSQFGITYATSGIQTRYFDASGTPTTSLNTNSRYRVDITWFDSGWSGLKYADVKVWWPAAATAADASGSTEMFAALDRN